MPIIYPNLMGEVKITPTTQQEIKQREVREGFDQGIQDLMRENPIEPAPAVSTYVDMPKQYRAGGVFRFKKGGYKQKFR